MADQSICVERVAVEWNGSKLVPTPPASFPISLCRDGAMMVEVETDYSNHPATSDPIDLGSAGLVLQ